MKPFVIAASLALSNLIAQHAFAAPAVGVGLTYVFGGSQDSQNGLALGVKAFSTDREDRAALSLGVDYVFASKAFRPNIGVAYLDKKDFYVGLNVGYNTKFNATDFGADIGYVKTKAKQSPLDGRSSGSGSGSGSGHGDNSGPGLPDDPGYEDPGLDPGDDDDGGFSG